MYKNVILKACKIMFLGCSVLILFSWKMFRSKINVAPVLTMHCQRSLYLYEGYTTAIDNIESSIMLSLIINTGLNSLIKG